MGSFKCRADHPGQGRPRSFRRALTLLLALGSAWCSAQIPQVDRFAAYWGRPGTTVLVYGRDLDRVDRVLLGHRRIKAFVAGPTGTSLAVTLPREEPLGSSSVPITFGWPGAGGQPRASLTPHPPFTLLPSLAASHHEGRPEVPFLKEHRFRRTTGGQELTLIGTHLEQVLALSIGGVRVVRMHLATPNVLRCVVPDGPAAADLEASPVTLTYRGGSLHFPEALTFTWKTIHDLQWLRPPPAHEPRAGHGGGAGAAASALPAGSSAGAAGDGPHSAGAGAGAASALSGSDGMGAGSASVPSGSAGAGAAAAPSDSQAGLRIVGVVVTQGAQRQDGSIPLVAGRDAAVRVFLQADLKHTEAPWVRVTVFGGVFPYSSTVMGGPREVPTDLAEDDEEGSFDLPLSGQHIREGASILVELEEMEHGVSRVVQRFPANGEPIRLPVVEVPPVRIILFPVRFQGDGSTTVGRVVQDWRTLESWAEDLRRLLPVGRVEVRLGETFEPALSAKEAKTPIVSVAKALETKRLLDDPWNEQFYYGVFENAGSSLGLNTGQAAPGPKVGNLNRTAVGHDGASYAMTFAQTMGIMLGLKLAPGGGVQQADPEYPEPDGTLDCTGYDLRAMRPLPASQWHDFMGGQAPQWVSAYNWAKALDRLTRTVEVGPSADPDKASGRTPLQACLLVSGTVLDNVVMWDPAFEIRGRPLARERGKYRLVCKDRHKHVLARVPFYPDATGTFEFLIPMTVAMHDSLSTFQVFEGDHRLAGIATWTGQKLGHHAAHAARYHDVAKQPWAVVEAPGRVRLEWDTIAYPKVLVLDAFTSKHLATCTPGAREFAHPGNGRLRLLMSDGIRTTSTLISIK